LIACFAAKRAAGRLAVQLAIVAALTGWIYPALLAYFVFICGQNIALEAAG